jgi:hypothetical protein
LKITDYITYIPPMKPFRPNWAAKIGELSAQGITREEATTALFRKVEQGFEGSYAPLVIPHCGYVAHIWRDPEAGWCYSIKGLYFDGRLDHSYCVVGGYDATIRAARKHLADYVYDDEEPGPTVRHPEEAAEVILDEADRREFISRAYRTKRVQAIMVERGVNWEQANMIEDGLLK